MNITEAINVVAGLDVKSEYEATAKELVLSYLEKLLIHAGLIDRYEYKPCEKEKECAEHDMLICSDCPHGIQIIKED